MAKQLENKFFGRELIIEENNSFMITLCRVDSVIIKKGYGYCGKGEWRPEKLGRYTSRESTYKELNSKLLAAGL